jgi:flagellin
MSTTTALVRSVQQTQRQLQSTTERLTSGRRINRAADDASQSAQADQLQARARSLRTAERNAYQGVYAAQIADGATDSVVDTLKRLRELAVQASSETLTDDERAYIDTERQAMVDEIQRVAENTRYNDVALTDGSRTSLSIEVDATGDANSRIALRLGDLRAATLGVDGLDLSSTTSARAALQTVDDAIDQALGYRSTYGAAQNRFEAAASNAIRQSDTAAASASAMVDADFAYEASELVRLQVANKAGVAALGQARRIDQRAVRGLLRSR